MARVRSLSPAEARKTLAHRLGSRLAPRLRQLATNLGVRPYHVFLVWQRWDGAERGIGTPTEVRREELLPTPRVQSLDGVAFSLLQAGRVPVGSIRVDRISVTYTQDFLLGQWVPKQHADQIPEPVRFFYEVIEDGRGDDPPARTTYRPMNFPFRRAGKVDWTIMLERIGQDLDRDGSPLTDEGTQG